MRPQVGEEVKCKCRTLDPRGSRALGGEEPLVL